MGSPPSRPPALSSLKSSFASPRQTGTGHTKTQRKWQAGQSVQINPAVREESRNQRDAQAQLWEPRLGRAPGHKGRLPPRPPGVKRAAARRPRCLSSQGRASAAFLPVPERPRSRAPPKATGHSVQGSGAGPTLSLGVLGHSTALVPQPCPSLKSHSAPGPCKLCVTTAPARHRARERPSGTRHPAWRVLHAGHHPVTLQVQAARTSASRRLGHPQSRGLRAPWMHLWGFLIGGRKWGHKADVILGPHTDLSLQDGPEGCWGQGRPRGGDHRPLASHPLCSPQLVVSFLVISRAP